MDPDLFQAKEALDPVIQRQVGANGIVTAWLTIIGGEDLDSDHRHISFVCSEHIPVATSIGLLTMVLDDLREAAKQEGPSW